MNGLIITTTNKEDLKLSTELAKRIGVKAKKLTDEELLDLGLLKAMKEGKKTKFVPKSRILSKLKIYGDKVS